jgi:hypothetical protein
MTAAARLAVLNPLNMCVAGPAIEAPRIKWRSSLDPQRPACFPAPGCSAERPGRTKELSKYHIVLTNRGLYSVPDGQKGIPIEDVVSNADMPPMFKGSKVYLTPRGVGIGPPELPGQANDPLPDKPVIFPSRDEQIRRRDAEFHARLERAYEKVKITAQPMQVFGDDRSGIENPYIAADEVRVLLMRHFPDGPGMAAVAQQAANRYNKASTNGCRRTARGSRKYQNWRGAGACSVATTPVPCGSISRPAIGPLLSIPQASIFRT